jgi:hypothetical protein
LFGEKCTSTISSTGGARPGVFDERASISRSCARRSVALRCAPGLRRRTSRRSVREVSARQPFQSAPTSWRYQDLRLVQGRFRTRWPRRRRREAFLPLRRSAGRRSPRIRPPFIGCVSRSRIDYGGP